MKRMLSVLLAILLVLTTTPLSVFAADTAPVIIGTVDADTVCPGNTVTLTVSMDNNPGIACWLIQVEYDDSALTLTQQTAGNAFDGGSLTFGPMKNPTTALWYDFISSSNYTNNGSLFTMTFTVNESAPEGDYDITLSITDPENILNQDLTPVAFEFESSSVRVGHTYDSPCDEYCNDCGAVRQGGGHTFTDINDLVCYFCGSMLDPDAALVYGVVDNPNVTRGDTFTLTVSMRNNPGLAGWLIEVAYDDSALTLTQQTAGNAFDGGSLTFGPMKNPTNALWCDFISGSNCTNNGDLYTLTFRVKENAAFGASLLNIDCTDPDNMCNINFERVHFDFIDTAVTVLNHTHGYDNVCDPVCDECGFTRTVPGHVYTDVCDNACNECGVTRVPPHTYTSPCDRDCNACGLIRVAPHVYSAVCDTRCDLCFALREAEPHRYDPHVTVAATCGADGVMTYTCLVCDDVYTDVIPATGNHTYSNGCDTTCNVCYAVRTASPHRYSDACDMDCNECGVTREPPHNYANACDQVCDTCGAIRVPSDHIYAIASTVSPTCTNDGSQTQSCIECGNSYTERLPALGHNYTSTQTAPTCTNRGYTTHTCIRCDQTYTDTYVDALGHAYSSTVVSPTCTAQGYTLHQCTVCEYTYKDTYTAMVDHLYGNWVTDKEATCVSAGEKTGVCQVCGEYVVCAIDPIGHGELTWNVLKEATAFEEGLREQWCGLCGEMVLTEVISMTKESFGYGESEDRQWIVGLPERTTPDMLIAHYENMGLTATVTGPNGEPVECVGSGCKVTFGDTEYTVVISGDTSGDGTINVMDLALMMRHLNNWDDPAYHDACDANGDGKVNNRDYALLQRYLNGWDVALG